MTSTILLAALRSDFPDAVAEHRFHPVRMWRFDYAIPSALIAVEIQGGCFAGGRHARGAGMRRDYEKFNAAAILGWRILYFLPEQISQVKATVWAAANRRDQAPTDVIHRRPQRALRKIETTTREKGKA